jgi:hypothetical protein
MAPGGIKERRKVLSGLSKKQSAKVISCIMTTFLLAVPATASRAFTINTVDGSPGEGLATSVAQHPLLLKIHENSLLVVDNLAGGVPPIDANPSNIIRRIDLSTNDERLIAGWDDYRNGGFSGDGGPAEMAQLSNAYGAAEDSAGNIFIADLGNNRIRRVDPTTETITTVVGTGTPGYSGDGGTAQYAELKSPAALTVDHNDNLYIADSGNYRVRKVSPTGIIATVAGNGTSGFSGDGGSAQSAQIGSISDLAVSETGDIYIADGLNGRVRKVDGTTGIISTVAGGGSSNADGITATSASLTPIAVAVDTSDNIFIMSGRVRRVDSSGLITTVAGSNTAGFSGDGGPASSAQLNQPRGLAVDGSGNLYIADSNNYRIRLVDAATQTINTNAGNGTVSFGGDGGPSSSARLDGPADVAIDSAGNRYIADVGNGRVRKVDAATGIISTVAGNGDFGFSGDGGLATNARLSIWFRVAVDSSGTLYIADAANERVRRVDSSTNLIDTIAGNGTANFSGDGGPATQASLSFPRAVVIDRSGNIYISDSGNNRIRRIDGFTKTINTVAGNGNPSDVFNAPNTGPALTSAITPVDLAISPADFVYFLDASQQLFVFYPSCETIERLASVFTSQQYGPGGLAVDPAENSFISTGHGHIFKVDPSGSITDIAGDTWRPEGLDVDQFGNLFIADPGHSRIKEIASVAETAQPVLGACSNKVSTPSTVPPPPLSTRAGWESLNGPITSGPDAASWAPGRLDVFARGTDNSLVHKWYGGGWAGFESLGGALTADPGAVSWGPNRIDVFVRGIDGGLYHRWWDGSAWGGYEPLGGVIADGTGPDVTSWGPGRLDVFVKGTDNQLWHKWYSGGWSGWEPLGGVLASDPTAVAWSSGRLDVFAKGTDNQLWHKWYAGGWSGWEPLGGFLTSAPDASSWAPGRLDVFAKGSDNTLIHKWYSGSWAGFESLGGNLTSAPGAVSWGTNRIDVFEKSSDNSLIHKWFTGSWST